MIRREQEAIYSQLHRELEETDMRVTRSRARGILPPTSARRGRRSRPRGRGRLQPRRGPGRRRGESSQPSTSQWEIPLGTDTLDALVRDSAFDSFLESEFFEDEAEVEAEVEPMVIPPDLDYDTDGNPIVPSNEESSLDD